LTKALRIMRVTIGITLTFDDLQITNDAKMEDITGQPILGLYARRRIAGACYALQASGARPSLYWPKVGGVRAGRYSSPAPATHSWVSARVYR
jgi:hypothetical protein